MSKAYDQGYTMGYNLSKDDPESLREYFDTEEKYSDLVKGIRDGKNARANENSLSEKQAKDLHEFQKSETISAEKTEAKQAEKPERGALNDIVQEAKNNDYWLQKQDELKADSEQWKLKEALRKNEARQKYLDEMRGAVKDKSKDKDHGR